ncbi:hypothetical protein AB0907_05705 [Streptomyces sp. NPDC006975]|uniref:hypothetical protein n=1 Tax=Streptomyces sp. NPDC006975 TaxID=3154310 RepID=UPI003451FEDB
MDEQERAPDRPAAPASAPASDKPTRAKPPTNPTTGPTTGPTTTPSTDPTARPPSDPPAGSTDGPPPKATADSTADPAARPADRPADGTPPDGDPAGKTPDPETPDPETPAPHDTARSGGSEETDRAGAGNEADTEAASASQVYHNNVNQYFLGALDAPEMHFGIGTGGGADSGKARRRAVGRLDAGEADAVLASYVEPPCFDQAVTALQRDAVVVLVGPPGTGKRAGAVALVAAVARGTDYVVLSPGRSLEELAGGRVEFDKGVGYLLVDRMHEGPSQTADFDWRRVRDTVRESGAHLVVTTVHESDGRSAESVRHVPWRLPDLAAVLRVRLTRAACAPDTVERAVALMPDGCRIAEVAAAADRIGQGAEPADVWREYGTGAAEPVRRWFDGERTPQEWAEVTTLAFVTGAGYRDFETCQQRLEQWLAPAFPEPGEEEAAEAARRAADRRLSLTRNSLVAVQERKVGALTRTALVFPHPPYQQWVLQELWTRRSTVYWDGVRDWLTELLLRTRPDLDLQLSVARALAMLTVPAFDEVAVNYLHPWATGAAGPAGRSTAILVLHWMCLDESLAAVALGVARGWARSGDADLRSAAMAAFSGMLGVRFPTDAVQALLRLTGRHGTRPTEAAFALAGLVAVLAQYGQDTGAVFRPLAHRLRAQRQRLAGHAKDSTLDTVLTVLRARDARTGRPVCADVLVHDPAQAERIAELWAGVLDNLPRRSRALAGLRTTVRALAEAGEEPERAATRFGAAVGAVLPPAERLRLRDGLLSREAPAPRTARTGPAATPLIDTFLTAVLSTED